MDSENEKIIRFIDSDYKTLFFVPDGGKIVITRPDGEYFSQPCRFIDEYHTQVGNRHYHICQFAELMEQLKNTYAPEILPELPDQCFSVLPDTGALVFIEKGKKGAKIHVFSTENPQTNRRMATDWNLRCRITPQMEAAMLGGALKGWASPAARVSSYDVYGKPVKPARAKKRKPKGMER